MNAKNCKLCNRIFNSVTGTNICPACTKELDSKFQEVKDFVRENPGSTVYDVVLNCEVDEHIVRQWIRDERLEFVQNSNSGIICRLCGKPIPTGEYCGKCKTEMLRDLQNAGKKGTAVAKIENKGRDKEKMRFLNR